MQGTSLSRMAHWVQGYMCASNTPCLDDSGQCTSRCIPLAASWCQGLCPNAMQYVPTTNPVRSWTFIYLEPSALSLSHLLRYTVCFCLDATQDFCL